MWSVLVVLCPPAFNLGSSIGQIVKQLYDLLEHFPRLFVMLNMQSQKPYGDPHRREEPMNRGRKNAQRDLSSTGMLVAAGSAPGGGPGLFL